MCIWKLCILLVFVVEFIGNKGGNTWVDEQILEKSERTGDNHGTLQVVGLFEIECLCRNFEFIAECSHNVLGKSNEEYEARECSVSIGSL